jgi:membrane protease YdiL (CAAX protease family)
MTRLLLSPPPAARAEQPPRAAPWRHPAAQGPEAQRAILWAYLLLVVALSVFPWTMIIRAGSLQTSGGAFGLLLMWSPGVAAITVSLLLRRSLRGQGWRPGSWRYLLAGYALPPLYALVAYGAVWATRAGIFPRASAVDAVAQQYGLSGRTPGAIIGGWVAVTALLALVALLTALGEEIGWRGLLLPELARRMSWHRAALVSGAIWALWHVPVVSFANYRGDGPLWYGLANFTVMAGALSVIAAWLRLRSGSLWPAALLHAAHNAWVQQFFDPITGDAGTTAWLVGEFGLALAVVTVALAWVFWRRPLDPLHAHA